MIPTALVSGTAPSGNCAEYNLSQGQEMFFLYVTISLYVLPLTVVICCYVRIGKHMLEDHSALRTDKRRMMLQKRRGVTAILIVVLFLVLSWLPLHTVHLWMAFHPTINAKSAIYVKVHTAANVLMFVNSSANPFIYTLVGPPFRKHIHGMLKSVYGCVRICGRHKYKSTHAPDDRTRERGLSSSNSENHSTWL